jgi:hypothetical protein
MRMRWVEHEALMGKKNTHTVLVGKSERKRLLVRTRGR